MEYKIPFRRIYCATFGQWLLEMFWIFVVIKLFPGACDFGNNFEWGESKTCPYCNSDMSRSELPVGE